MKIILEIVETSKTRLFLYLIFIICIFLLYAVHFNSYRAELLDNAWMMHNIYIADYTKSSFGYASGAGGGSFGSLFKFIYSEWFNLVGWDRDKGFILSITFTIFSVFIFYISFRKLGYSQNVCLATALLISTFDPYVGMAHKLRPEAFILFLIAVSFLFFVKKYYFWSGFISILAIETHPAGAFVFAYIGSVFIYRSLYGKRLYARDFFSLMLGTLLGIFFYIALHYDIIKGLSNISRLNSEHSISDTGYLFKMYFWAPWRKYYYRHIPEILAIAIMLFYYIKNKFYKNEVFFSFDSIFLVLIIISAILIPRANYQYMVYVFVPIILVMVKTFNKLKRLNLFLILFLAIQIPQYLILQYLNYGYDHNKKKAEYQKVVPTDKILIGPETVWYAFKDKNYKTYEYYYRWTRGNSATRPYYNKFPDEFTLIVDPFFRKKFFGEFVQTTKSQYNVKKITEFYEHYKNRLIEVYSYSKIAPLEENKI